MKRTFLYPLVYTSAAAACICSLSGCSMQGRFPGSSNPRHILGKNNTNEIEGEESVFEDSYRAEIETEAVTEAFTEAETEDPSEEALRLQAEWEQENMNLRHQLYYFRQLYGENFFYGCIIPCDESEPPAAPAFMQRIPVISSDFPNLDFLLRYPVPLPERSMSMLRSRLEGMLAEYDGNWSVYVKDLKSHKSLMINDVPMKSASVMKLFVMGCVYKAIEEGELDRTSDVVALMSGMITASSNENTNALLYLLGEGSYAKGIEKVNAFISSAGYSDETREYNGFQNSATVVDPYHTNQVGAKDCARLLEKIYHRTFGTRTVCNEAENWMLNQQHRSKIPAGIDSRSMVGNKTGETDDTENDVAIVYTPKGDYILCVLSNEWESKETAQKRITAVSKEVYAYFMDEDYVTNRFFIPGP